MIPDKPAAPKETVDAYYKGIDQFGGALQRRGEAEIEQLPVYTLTLDDLLREDALDWAKPAGWQFVTPETEAEFVAAHVCHCNVTNQQRLMGLTRGDCIKDIYDHLRNFNNFDALKNDFQYELRILKIPGALFEAIWLKPKMPGSGADDLLITVCSPSKLDDKMKQPLAADKVLGSIRDLAERFLGFETAV